MNTKTAGAIDTVRNLRQMFKKTTFRKYLFSFVLAFVLPLMLLIVVLSGLLSNIEIERRTNGRLVLERFVAGTDGQLYNILRSGGAMLTNERVLYFSTIADPSEYRTNTACFTMLRSLMKDVSTLVSGNDEILAAYLYFGNTDCVVGSSYMAARTYFERNLTGEYADFDAWIAFLSGAADGFSMQTRPNGQNGMTYLRSTFRGDVKLVIELEPDKIVGTELSARGAAIYNRNGDLQCGDTALFPRSLPDVIDAPSGERDILLLGQNAHVFWSRSDYTGCTYLTATPSDEYFAEVRDNKTLSILSVLILLLAESWLAYFLAKRRYRPIEQLSSIVRPEDGAPDARDDLAYLKDMLGAIKSERHEINQRLRASNQNMEHFVLEQLLRGTYPSVKVVEEQLLALDIVFDSNIFAVLGVRLDSLPPPDAPTDDPAKLEESRRLTRFVARNILEEALADFSPLVLEMSNRVYFLLTLPEGEDEARSGILACVTRAKDTLKNHYGMTLSAALSDRADGMNNISNAFYASREALNHLKAGETLDRARGEHAALEGANLQELAESAGRRLEHMLATGDRAAVSGELDAFEQSAADASTWSRRMALCALISGATKSAAAHLSPEQSKAYQRALRGFIESPPAPDDAKKARALLLSLISDASERLLDDKNAENAQKAVTYIERHYMESNLNVTMVADVMHLTPSYASATFKKCVGKSVQDVIHFARIRHAKDMLSKTKQSVEEIAEQSGYYNVSTFIRIFKKYEGVTPGQYRTIHTP